MTTWNHRMVHSKDENTGEDILELAEVYYRDDGKPEMYGRPFLHSETVEGLRETAQRLLAACDKPVLEHDEIIANGVVDD